MKTLLENSLPFVWCYWEGLKNPVIELCRETIEKHTTNLRYLDESSIKEYLTKEEIDFAKDFPAPQRSDYYRLILLYRFGGVWIDSDTVLLRELDFLKSIPTIDLLGVYNPHYQGGYGKYLLSTPWGARAGSPIVYEMIQECKKLLLQMQSGTKVSYGATSVGLLSSYYAKYMNTPSFNLKRFQHWRYNRVVWTKAREVYLSKTPLQNFENSAYYTPNSISYHLTNPITHALRQKQREQILEAGLFLSRLFGKALTLPKIGMYGRTYEIVKRLSKISQPTLCEVGVHRGFNARMILQQLPEAYLHLVDPWEPTSTQERYKKTTDRIAFFTKERRSKDYQEAKAKTKFAEDRITIHRNESKEASFSFADESLDLVFIDAEHSKEAILEDLSYWYPKVKQGGYIGGHDYANQQIGNVKEGVDQFVKENNLDISLGYDDTFFLIKNSKT